MIVVSVVLLALFLAGAIFNMVALVRRGRGPSPVPLLPGLIGLAGLWLLPVPGAARFAWVTLLLDVGCVPYLVFAIFSAAGTLRVHSRRNLMHELHGAGEGSTLRLSCYRNGDCVRLETRTAPQWSERSAVGTWRQEGDALLIEIAGTRARLARGDDGTYTRTPESDAGVADLPLTHQGGMA
jgi:hypothetical protein